MPKDTVFHENKASVSESTASHARNQASSPGSITDIDKRDWDNALHGNLFLIGFMGCGKSTVSRYLHEQFGMEVVEMDEVIAKREGMSIPDIFAARGEEYFRNAETALLAGMQGRQGAVVSCGGGVPLREENVRQMRKSGRVVLLTAHPETILERIRDDHSRPLLENNKDAAFIRGMMEERREKYEAAADITVSTDGRTAGEICAEIASRLRMPDAARRDDAQ